MSKVLVTISSELVARHITNLTSLDTVLTEQDLRDTLDALRNAEPAEVWQPVEVTTHAPEWACACGSAECNDGRTLYMESANVIGIWADNGMFDMTIHLPDDIRLCRRRPEGA